MAELDRAAIRAALAAAGNPPDVDGVDMTNPNDYIEYRCREWLTALLSALEQAERDCAQFCGDNERLIKAVGSDNVERALVRIAHNNRVLDSVLLDRRRLEQRAEQAEAREVRLRGALEAVEWIETFDYHNGAFDYLCPWCYADGEEVPGGDQHLLKHAADCPRQAALAGKE